jgi:hypothetical protein
MGARQYTTTPVGKPKIETRNGNSKMETRKTRLTGMTVAKFSGLRQSGLPAAAGLALNAVS